MPFKTQIFGWDGHIGYADGGIRDPNYQANIRALLDMLKADGWNCVRPKGGPPWLQGGGAHPVDLPVIDFIVQEAKARNMFVLLCLSHAFRYGGGAGSGAFIDGREQEWINWNLQIAERYRNFDNVLIDAWSEYSGTSVKQQQNAQALITALRAAGYNLPLHFNIWWGTNIFALNDPADNYSVGRHHYYQTKDSYGNDYGANTNPKGPFPINYDAILEDSGCAASMERYFNEHNYAYIWRARELGIPNGYWATEDGGSETHMADVYSVPGVGKASYSMSVGNMIYMIEWLRRAKASNDVSFIMHRVGLYNDYPLYYYYAKHYFNMAFWQAPTPTPPILATLGGIVIGGGIGYALNRKKPVVPIIVGAAAGGTLGFIIDRTLRS